MANRDLARTMGWATIEALGTDPAGLFGNEFDDLEAQWDEWLAGAQDEVAQVASALGMDPDGEAIASFRAKQDNGRKAGWAVLAAGLVTAAQRCH